MTKKINLEEIYNQFEYLSRVETDSSNIDYKGSMIKAMKEACRQTLELAAENAATIDVGTITDEGWMAYDIVDKQSILDTINQIE